MKEFNLCRIREQVGLTQKEFSRKIGISEAQLSRFEVEPMNTPIKVVLRISEIFGFKIDDILIEENDEILQICGFAQSKLWLDFQNSYNEKKSFLENEKIWLENFATDEKTKSTVRKIIEKTELSLEDLYSLPKIIFFGNSSIEKQSCLNFLKNAGFEDFAKFHEIETVNAEELISADGIFLFNSSMNDFIANNIFGNQKIRENKNLSNLFIFNSNTDSITADSKTLIENQILSAQNIDIGTIKKRFFSLSRKNEISESLESFFQEFFSRNLDTNSINESLSEFQTDVKWNSLDSSMIFNEVKKTESRIGEILSNFESATKDSVIKLYEEESSPEKILENQEIQKLRELSEMPDNYPFKLSQLREISDLLCKKFIDSSIEIIQQENEKFIYIIEDFFAEIREQDFLEAIFTPLFKKAEKTQWQDSGLFQFKKSMQEVFSRQTENLNTFSRGMTKSKLKKISASLQMVDSKEISKTLDFYFSSVKEIFSEREILEFDFINSDYEIIKSELKKLMDFFPKIEEEKPVLKIQEKIPSNLSEHELIQKILEILSKDSSKAELIQVNWNLLMDTMGGNYFWNTLASFEGWKFQQHFVFGNCRIIDPKNRRFAWGSFEKFMEKFREVLED